LEEVAVVVVEEEVVTEGEDQFGLTSINIDIFFSPFNKDTGSPVFNITVNTAPIFFILFS